jgi:hypothetical protein
MGELIAILKKSHEINVKMRWLKMIDKENNKYRKLREKSHKQWFIILELLKEYKKEFGEDLRKGSAE